MKPELICALCLLAALLIFLLVRRLAAKKHHGDSAYALQKTARLLEQLGGEGSVSYLQKTLTTAEGDQGSVELINVASDRVYAVKVYSDCEQVSEGPGEEFWTFRMSGGEHRVANPLPELAQQRILLTRLFQGEKLRNIPVQTLVVFADSLHKAAIRLPASAGARDIRELKAWRKASPLTRTPLDREAVIAALEKGVKS